MKGTFREVGEVSGDGITMVGGLAKVIMSLQEAKDLVRGVPNHSVSPHCPPLALL